ncbi:MAG: AAA family ATPase, partial [Acidobacteria bacterium]|nr:AAA family ATPase [Acidobacteriota bacterium]
MAFLGRFLQPPEASHFLFGPRGTGKSTFLRRAFADALWVDLLRPEVEHRFAARPDRLRELVDGEPEAGIVVIDEVQKVPALLDEVHFLIERRGRRAAPRFVLTGSSARKLRRTGVNLLAGRLLLARMHPFMAAELPSFDLGLALRRGLLPVVWDSDTPDATLASYVALYVREEVQAEGLVRRLDDFARFVEAVSFSHGSVLNVSEVAREVHASRKTV